MSGRLPDNQVPLLDETEQTVPVWNIYKITTKELMKIFGGPPKGDPSDVMNEKMDDMRQGRYQDSDYQLKQKQAETIAANEGVEGILKKLASNENTGIVGDLKDLKRRKRVFGENCKPAPPKASIVESMKQTMREILWVVIGATALLSTLLSFFIGKWKEGAEGLSIIFMSLILIAITTIVDYVKDRKFIELFSLVKEESLPVIRGKLGATQTISVWDMVVGDVVLLNTGDMVPADCIVITSTTLKVDEPYSLNKGVSKSEEEDPVLLAGSLVSNGHCKALVCVVGKNSSRGILEAKLDTEKDTPLQKKLKNLTQKFTKFALICCLIILILSVIMLIVRMTKGKWWEVLLTKAMKLANQIVVLFVVIVPEGLPLTVGVSLAFTTSRMYKTDRILVRQLDAPETMGKVNELLVGKSGTLTTASMKVGKFYTEQLLIKNTRKNTLINCELREPTFEIIKESILFNCSARIEIEGSKYVPVGNPTECGLLAFLQDADIPAHLLIQQKLGRIKAQIPFSSVRKLSITAVQHPTRQDQVVIYLKGAPEHVLQYCQSFEGEKETLEMTQEEMDNIMKETTDMAYQPLRVIAFAYSVMDINDWRQNFEDNGRQFEQAFDENQISFTFIAVLGLSDPLRKNVKSAIKYAQKNGHVKVRMISGDHVETAKRTALKAGIVSEQDLESPNAVMDAETFRDLVGGLQQQPVQADPSGQEPQAELTLENFEDFARVIPELRVLARADATDKLLMVTGLKQRGDVVAVTGEGIADIDALMYADVGLAMGSGCAAAKMSSDLILTDNDFESSIRAIMWGRNIYHNVSRFLQFQITVNISCLLIMVFGILFFAEAPFSAVQLLWINMIMDTFAALALSTEPPLEKVLLQPSTSNSTILNAAIWRQILGVSLWQFLIAVILFIFGGYIGSLEDFEYYQNITIPSPSDYCDTDDIAAAKKQDATKAGACKTYWGAQAKKKLLTYILCAFVYMQVFNYINCRKIGRKELNVFERFLHNYYFLLIFGITFVGQWIFVQWFAGITRTSRLDRSEWGACIVAGASVLLIAWVIKFIPKKALKKIPFTQFVDEDKQEDDKLAQWALSLNQNKIDIPDVSIGKDGKANGQQPAQTADESQHFDNADARTPDNNYQKMQ